MSHPAAKVLYVDDEASNLAVFRAQFRKTMEVRTASSGAEALEILATEEIPVLLTDQRMPKMNGAELAAEVRRRHPDVVRMVVTAYSDFDAVVRSINEGNVSRYIQKPWMAEELGSIISTACELYWTTKQNRALTEDLLYKKRLGAVASLAEDLTRQLEGIGSCFDVVDRIDLDSPDAERDVETVHAAVQRLIGIIDDLRQFSKRSAFDRASVKTEELGAVLIRSAELLRLFPAVRALSGLEVERSDEPLAVQVDGKRIGQVLVNLVLNLISESEAPSGRVVLRADREGGQAVISFRGDGARLSHDATAVLSGSGLGSRGALWLLLAQRVLDDYDARLRLSSGTLELALPLAQGGVWSDQDES